MNRVIVSGRVIKKVGKNMLEIFQECGNIYVDNVNEDLVERVKYDAQIIVHGKLDFNEFIVLAEQVRILDGRGKIKCQN